MSLLFFVVKKIGLHWSNQKSTYVCPKSAGESGVHSIRKKMMCRNRNQSIWNGLENGMNKPVINCQSYCWWFRNPKQPLFGCFEKAQTVNNGRFQLPNSLNWWVFPGFLVAINRIIPIWDGWMENFQAHSNCVSSSSQAKTSTQPRSKKKRQLFGSEKVFQKVTKTDK